MTVENLHPASLGSEARKIVQGVDALRDQWKYWREALAGKPIDTEPGNPRTGYYRSQTGDELVGIWREADGVLQCERSKYGNGSRMTADEIDELFSSVCRYPLTYEIYSDVAYSGGILPPEYKTRLTLKEIQAGVAWTETLGRQKLTAKDIETYDEDGKERPGLGHNNPPEELTPDHALAKRILDLGVQFKGWLEKVGGAPKTQAEAEILGGYANKFKDFENEAVSKHKVEKQPHLDAGRQVDAKWFSPVRDKAIASRDRVIAIIRAFEKAEDDRKAEEARIANEAARKAAEQTAAQNDAPPPVVDRIAPERTKISTLRGGGPRSTEKIVTELAPFLAYCASLENPPPDLIEAAEKIGRKFRSAGVKAPGMREQAA